MPLITEIKLREQFKNNELSDVYYISKDDKFTPSARDFLSSKRIQIIVEESVCAPSLQEIQFSKPLNKEDWETPKEYKNFYTNELMNSKPEFMTHLFENVLVDKDDPRIILRGRLDTLQGHIIDIQILFCEKNRPDLVASLDDLLAYCRQIVRHEVINQDFPNMKVLGMSEEEIHEKSHNPEKYFNLKQMVLVDYKLGVEVAKLNILRAYARECELVAVKALKGSNVSIIQALNRLSSCFHLLMYQEIAKRS